MTADNQLAPANSLHDSTLIVLGHGSTKNAESAAPVFLHAAELRRRQLFAEVREAFWKQEPQVKTVLTQIRTRRVFIAPLFISEGYFSANIIPAELGFEQNRVLQRGENTWHYCRAAGTHDQMTGIVLARAREVVRRFPFPRAPKPADIDLFLAGHGTPRDPNSRAAIEQHAERIRARGEFRSVQSVFLEEPPWISDCCALAQARHVVVVPFFISEGMHTQEDIPMLLGEPERLVRQRLACGQPAWRNPTGRNGRLVWYAEAVGTDPAVADILLARVREAAAES